MCFVAYGRDVPASKLLWAGQLLRPLDDTADELLRAFGWPEKTVRSYRVAQESDEAKGVLSNLAKNFKKSIGDWQKRIDDATSMPWGLNAAKPGLP